MKFEYEDKQDGRECVAFVTANGNLVIKNTDTGNFTIALCRKGGAHNEAVATIGTATHKFYPGDKVTITF